MGQTFLYRERRNAVAAWLRDRFGDDVNTDDPDRFVPDSFFWRDAADLLKFLDANGFKIVSVDEETPAPANDAGVPSA